MVNPPEMDLSSLFDAGPGPVIAVSSAGQRNAVASLGGDYLRDDIDGAVCCFLRVGDADSGATLRLSGQYRIESASAGGWLLTSDISEHPFYWLPTHATARRLNDDGHILEEAPAELSGFQVDSDGLSLTVRGANPGCAIDLAVWRLPAAMAPELKSLSSVETQPVFLWGSHTLYTRPADVYAHLIHGQVYERGFAWPHKRKICSENDAHALYVTLCGLERATGKVLYRLLKAQLLLSVLARQGADGGFRHGEWSANMESHYRLHASGMHLMMDALAADAGDTGTRAALTRAADFVAAKTDTLEAGTWFLHDEMETNESTMASAPFRWVRSRALGKRESNMLVLNTQLDTSVALDRFGAVTGDARHAAAVTSAQSATLAVLALRPAEALYRLVFWVVGLTLLPTAQAAQLPAWQRAIKRLGWKYVLPRLPDLKARFPRLVMPGGYVDRELVLRTWAHHYLSINLMDLARYQRRMPSPEVERVIRDAAAFAHDSGILQRWAELKYEKYALGFWAEALYHLCMLSPDAHHYRAWLVEAVVLLEDNRQGLPPSLMGANAEALPPAEQVPCPMPVDAQLRVINLGRKGRSEVLVVNPTQGPIALAWFGNAPAGVTWHQADGSACVGEPVVAPRAWLWGRVV